MGHCGAHDYHAATQEEPRIFITRRLTGAVDAKMERALQVEAPEEIPQGFSPRYTSSGYYRTSFAGRQPSEEASLNTYYGTPPNEDLHLGRDRYLQEYKKRRVTRGERVYA